MKFTTATVVGLCIAGTASAFTPMQSSTSIASSKSFTTLLHQSTETEPAVEEERRRTKKADRLDFMKNEQFHRRGFKEVRDKVEADVQQQYTSELVGELKSSNYIVDREGVKVYLAKVRDAALNVGRLSIHPSREMLTLMLIPTISSPFLSSYYYNLLLCRILDFVGASNDPLLWPMRPSNTIRIASCTLPMN
jgi:hypothetical protein